MMRREYHYLVAGLPGISIGERSWTSMAEFRAQLQAHLHPEDFMQVQFIFLQEDHQNLLHFLKTGKFPGETAGNFSLEDFTNPENQVPGTDPESEFMPRYISDVLAQFAPNQKGGQKKNMAIGQGNTGTGNSGDSENDAQGRNASGSKQMPAGSGKENEDTHLELAQIQQTLDEGFFRLIMEEGNEFLRGYYTFHYDLNNLLTFIKSGLHGMDQATFLTGDTPHAQHLVQFAGRNLVSDPEMEHFEEITSISGNASFAEEEKQIDQLRWRVIDEMNRFEYFTIDRILGYLLQMQVAERWERLDRESGEKQLRELIDVSYRSLAKEQLVQKGTSA